MTELILKIVVGLLIWAFVAAVVLFVFDSYESTPVVYRSWSTKECVAAAPAPYSCIQLPERYETVWTR